MLNSQFLIINYNAVQLFYTQRITTTQAWLEEEEMQHCVRTLRRQVGDVVELMDGKGNLYKAVIEIIEKKQVQLRLQGFLPSPPARNFGLHIAIAPTKNIDRMEFFLEKATEMGIDTITPLRCQRSERREIRIDRLEKVILSAAKQSIQTTLPVLTEMIDFKDFIQKNKATGGFIAHCNNPNLPLLITQYKAPKPALILIGPEGDFSPAEVELASAQGFCEISLGTSRLRTETAAMLACMQIHTMNDLRLNDIR